MKLFVKLIYVFSVFYYICPVSQAKIGIIIPDRGDRPEFLNNCLRMMREQTMRPDEIQLIDFPAKDPKIKDITLRYRRGYENFGNRVDCILFVENDDWYKPNYIETMVTEWERQNRPELLGVQNTIYYHLAHRRWKTMHTLSRSSAMSTLIKPNLNFLWGPDHDPYTDMWLWTRVAVELKWRKMVINFPELICMGMKHGKGLCGGYFHTDRLDSYKENDADLSYLKSHLDTNSFNFFSTVYEDIFNSPITG